MSDTLDPKVLLAGALAHDAEKARRRQAGAVVCFDARTLLHGTTRKQDAKANGKPGHPDLMTLRCPPEVIKSLRGSPAQAEVVVLVVALPTGLAREVYRQATAKIVKPSSLIVPP